MLLLSTVFFYPCSGLAISGARGTLVFYMVRSIDPAINEGASAALRRSVDAHLRSRF